ncbi:MAG TPA: redoxin domain-containing protein [Halobacteriales archaeon]|nr:redoxin domain-containing protein [Halobacteriales archaeon]
MVDVGDAAPDFTAPLANGDVGEFTLSGRLDEAPIVLAFFPAAFTEGCSQEMEAFQSRLDRFDELDATVYGVSVDSPFSLNEFRDQLGLEFDLISDANREVISAYDVSIDFEPIGVRNIADRAVFVIDGDSEVVYRWIAENPTYQPDYDAVETAAAEA